MALNLRTKIVTTTPYTIVNSDDVIFVNVLAPASIILPTGSGNGDNEKPTFYIKDYSGTSKTNPIIITAPNGKTIDGAAFAILNQGYSHVQIVYDGTNWKTI